MFVEPRHDLDEITWPRPVVELGGKNAVPRVAAGARGSRQAEDEGGARDTGGGTALDRRGADLGVAQHVKRDRETIHPLFEQRLDRLRRHVATGEAGAAGRKNDIDTGIGDPSLDGAADRLDVVRDDLARRKLVAGGGEAFRQRGSGFVIHKRARVGNRQHRDVEGYEFFRLIGGSHALLSSFPGRGAASFTLRRIRGTLSPATTPPPQTYYTPAPCPADSRSRTTAFVARRNRGERIRHHPPGRLPLQRVVADRGRRRQRRVDVAGFEEARTLLLFVIDPDTREAIRLQLDLDLQRVGFRPVAGRLLQPRHARQDAEQVLDVMARFMGDDIGRGELAGIARAAVKAGFDLPEKSGVEKNLFLRWAIKRPHRRLRHAAAPATGGVAKQHDARPRIGLPAGLEDLAPAIVDLAEDAGNHAAHFVGRRAGLAGGRSAIGLIVRLTHAAGENFPTADQNPRIDAEGIADKAEHDHGADAEPATAHRQAETAAHSTTAIIVATVFNVVAATEIIVTHGGFSLTPSCRRRIRRSSTRRRGKISNGLFNNPPGKNCLVNDAYQTRADNSVFTSTRQGVGSRLFSPASPTASPDRVFESWLCRVAGRLQGRPALNSSPPPIPVSSSAIASRRCRNFPPAPSIWYLPIRRTIYSSRATSSAPTNPTSMPSTTPGTSFRPSLPMTISPAPGCSPAAAS